MLMNDANYYTDIVAIKVLVEMQGLFFLIFLRNFEANENVFF
jgi:hypothetical protein